ESTRHIFSTSTLLDGAENHRSHWMLGTGDFSRTAVAYSWLLKHVKTGKYSRLVIPGGLIMAYDSSTAWVVKPSSMYEVHAYANLPFEKGEKPRPDFDDYAKRKEHHVKWIARTRYGLRVRSIIKADDNIVLGSVADSNSKEDPFASIEGFKGGVLFVISADNGERKGEIKLTTAPVWDGVAVANSRIYVSTVDGRVVCLGK
ncbi:PQQ-binding-like beta-propeller repeat protein, partial [Verrucomicrobiota bacterium]